MLNLLVVLQVVLKAALQVRLLQLMLVLFIPGPTLLVALLPRASGLQAVQSRVVLPRTLRCVLGWETGGFCLFQSKRGLGQGKTFIKKT